jgi:iron complex outermembrane recepter protein
MPQPYICIAVIRCAVAASLVTTTLSLSAAETSSTPELETVVVSATRLRGVQDIDVPASVTTVQLQPETGNRTQTEVTEVLSGVPGVTALDRQNYAQDTQLSIRGFGARATFGVRGVRLFADGIPASMPDGQGQLSHFNVLGADRVQILRGPFSALYGNSSGGVVQLWSRQGTAEPSARLRATYGSYDTRTFGAQTLGELGPVNYNVAISRLETDGYRDHSAAKRDSLNGRFAIDVGANGTLALVVNAVDIPEAQDTLGLTNADWRINPRQTASVATQFNTRKSVQQLQGGLVFEQRLNDAQTIRAMAYSGNRKVEQFLAIPIATQANALHSGGVVNLNNDFRGADLRWSWEASLAERPLELTLGSNFDLQSQLRRGYNNFVGSALGMRGNLRRDETNRVENFDQFAQAWWQFAPQWSVLAGARASKVHFKSVDRYIVGTNLNDGGRRQYSDTTLVGGLMYRASESLRLYVSGGDGFETPTFNELSYRADGTAGLAFNLQPAISKDWEVGAKWQHAEGAQLEFALFRANTQDELAVARNLGGRSSFLNVDQARRQGAEIAAALPLANGWKLTSSYTLLDAKFRSSYRICTAAPCPVANVVVAAGSRIPGIANHQGQLQIQKTAGNWNAALEFQASSSLFANDVNTIKAPGYGLWNAEFGHRWQTGQSSLRGFARVENLLGKTYVGSVIVNEGNSRFFESGPEQTALIGLQWQWR